MADRKYYVLCDYNCKFESMTKEQILTAITQALESGVVHDVDTGFVQTIKTINGKALKFFVGEQSEYEALTDAEKDNLFAIITNDTEKESLLQAINNIIDGTTQVKSAKEADSAKTAETATKAKTLADCTEATLDEENGGFIITEAGIYALIGFYESEEHEAMREYITDIVAIPFVERKAVGSIVGASENFLSMYDSYDNVNYPYNPNFYRLGFNLSRGITNYKAIKIASL